MENRGKALVPTPRLRHALLHPSPAATGFLRPSPTARLGPRWPPMRPHSRSTNGGGDGLLASQADGIELARHGARCVDAQPQEFGEVALHVAQELVGARALLGAQQPWAEGGGGEKRGV